MQTQNAENQATAQRAAYKRREAQIPLLDGTYVIVSEDAKEDLQNDYGITGGRFRDGEVQVWVEGRIVNCGKVIQRSASYVSLKDVLSCWVYDLKYLVDDDDQVFVLKDGNPRNLLRANISVSARRPEYI